MDSESVGLGDIVIVDAAVFHRSGVDGTCHIESGIEYVLMDEPGAETGCVLTVEQEDELDASIAGVLYSLTLDFTGGVDSLESHPSVYEVVGFAAG